MTDPADLQVVLVDPTGAERAAGDPVGVAVDAVPVDDPALAAAGVRAWRVTLRLRADVPWEGGVRVRLPLGAAPEPWWLIPGAFYGENRPKENDRRFPRFEIGACSPEEHAAFVSDTWEFRADRAATPAVLAWPEDDAPGAGLAADETTALGLTGLRLEHRDGQGAIAVTFPFREGPVSYYGDGEPRPAETTTFAFVPGEAYEVAVTLYALPADRHAYTPVLRAEHRRHASAAPLRPWVDVATAAELTAYGLRRWHYDPDPGILLETVGFDREVSGQDGKRVDRQAMHVGWVSGAPWAAALLQHGLRVDDPEAVDAARSVLDFLCTGLAPSGTFWGVWYRQHGWSQSWSPVQHALHSRTLGEATLFLARALALEPAHDDWRAAVRSNLDAVVGRQRADGNPGSTAHALTGEVLSWDGTAGLMWVAALAEARALDERYLPAACAAGAYYAPFVDREYLHGAPEDVDLAPTQEDGIVAVVAYTALYRETGDERWLDLARRAADWMLTFRYSYDVSFDPATLLGVYDFGTRGADQASSSNQHLHAYGMLCTSELLDLAEATGDDHYRERALETLACFRQFVARRDGDFNAYRGMVSERYYQTACFQPKGMLLTLSHAWSVGVLLLGCEQVLARGIEVD